MICKHQSTQEPPYHPEHKHQLEGDLNPLSLHHPSTLNYNSSSIFQVCCSYTFNLFLYSQFSCLYLLTSFSCNYCLQPLLTSYLCLTAIYSHAIPLSLFQHYNVHILPVLTHSFHSRISIFIIISSGLCVLF